jgi:hypothetical protein
MLAIEDLARHRVDLTMALLFAEACVEARRFVPIVDCHASTNATIVLALLAMHGCGAREGAHGSILISNATVLKGTLELPVVDAQQLCDSATHLKISGTIRCERRDDGLKALMVST